MHLAPRQSALFAFSALCAATGANGQCTNPWHTGDGTPGANREVLAATNWDPDGPGPLGVHVVLGGRFTLFGDVAAARIVLWDPTTGTAQALGDGFDLDVKALLVLPNGDLVAGGDFGASGTASMLGIARWNGSAWEPLGNGLGERVGSLGLANGDLVASAASATALRRWDGMQWSPLGSSILVQAGRMANQPNGDLVLGGDLWVPTGIEHLARWDGSAWSSIGNPNDTVQAMASMQNGDLVIAGTFTSIGSVPIAGLARWNGTTWTGIPGAPNPIRVLHELPNGDLLAGGDFDTAGGVATGGLARWNGTAWSSLLTGSSPRPVTTLTALPGGQLLVGGSFQTAQGQPARCVARLTGTGFQTLFGGSPARVLRDARVLQNGELVAIGSFDFTGTTQEVVARRIGSSWFPLGPSLAAAGSRLEVLPNGDVVALVGNDLQRFDGSAWTTISLGGGIAAFVRLANGDLLATGTAVPLSNGGTARLARWNGTTWDPVPPMTGSFGTALPTPMAATADGGFVVTGLALQGSTVTRRFWRWNGAGWSTFDHPGPLASIAVLQELLDGSLVAGGQFFLERWDGSAWSSFGTGHAGTTQPLFELPNGDLLASGSFQPAGATAAASFARWDGTTWTGLADVPNGSVTRMVGLPNGDVAMVGSFTAIGDQPAAYHAELTTTCPATRTVTGPGCGNLTLTTTLPWTGSALRADASGLVAPSIAYWVLGLSSTSIPIGAVIPTALPGCVLHVTPDAYGLQFSTDGHSRLALALPDVPALVGVALHHQQVALALDATFAVSATEAQQLTVGSF